MSNPSTRGAPLALPGPVRSARPPQARGSASRLRAAGVAAALLLGAGGCASDPPEGSPGPRPTDAAADPAGPPPVPEDWVWTFRADPPRALFGPPASEAVLVVECRTRDTGAPGVVHTVYAPADSGGTAELVITGNGERAVVPVGAVYTELGPDHVWEGVVDLRAVRAPFLAGGGPVTFAIEGSAVWTVPGPDPVRRVLAACGDTPQNGSPTPK